MSEEEMREMGRKLGREIGRAVTLFTAAVMGGGILFGYGFGLPDRTVGIACMAVGLVIAIAALVVLRIWANSPTAEDE